MTREEISTVMKIICETRDEIHQANKSLNLFRDTANWKNRYDQPERIETFNFMNYDPRQLADHGGRALEKAKEKLDTAWYEFRDLLSKLDTEEIKKDKTP
jgi:hypothetical protein